MGIGADYGCSSDEEYYHMLQCEAEREAEQFAEEYYSRMLNLAVTATKREFLCYFTITDWNHTKELRKEYKYPLRKSRYNGG